MKKILTLILCLTANACATQNETVYSATTSPQISVPPAVDVIMLRYEGDKVCQYIYRAPETITLNPDLDIQRDVLCAPVFPERLIQRGYSANCEVSYTVNEAGYAVDPVSKCRTHTFDYGETYRAWNEFADATFTELAKRSVEQSHYVVKPEAQEEYVGKTIIQPITFKLVE